MKSHLTLALVAGALTLSTPTHAGEPSGILPEAIPFLEYEHSSGTLTQPIDNTKGSWLNFETAPVDPLLLLDYPTLGRFLMVLNQPAMTLEVYEVTSGALAFEMPLGPGAVALVPRPNGTPFPTEFWVVDRVMSTIFVVGLAPPLSGDGQVLSILRTIPVGGEPHGLAFHVAGQRAYVLCSATRELKVINAATYSVLPAETVSLPLDSPRNLALINGRIWIAPLNSGNNTFPWVVPDSNLPYQYAQVVDPTDPRFAGLQLASLPDADLVSYDPLSRSLQVHATGLGTNLFHVRARAGVAQIWVPNTEARNRIRGGKNLDSHVVQNRLSIVRLLGGNPLIVDLDTLAGVPAGVHCAQPTDVRFDPIRSRAFVCGYGSDTVFELDTQTEPPTFVRHFSIPGVTTALGRSGPRNLLLDPEGLHLYTFNKADNSYSVVDLQTSQVETVALAHDPTPASVKRGRMHFISADLSRGGTSSCNSCHIDGHVDGVAWDLSDWLDPVGTPADQLTFEKDKKGVMVTQTLRGLREKGPYHWRGERPILEDFNAGGFQDLLQHQLGGQLAPLPDADYADAKEYMFSLVHPVNPDQPLDRRVPAGPPLDGLADYLHFPGTASGFSCNDCHTLPIGTNNEIQRQAGFSQVSGTGQLAGSAVVMQLRGVNHKFLDTVDVNGDGEDDVTQIGLGIRHRADFPTLKRFLEVGFNNLDDVQEDNIVAFVNLLDTGIAPAATYAATSDVGRVDEFMSQHGQFLIDQAEAGHCDLIFRGPSMFLIDRMVTLSGVYDRSTKKFQLATTQWPPSSMEELIGTYPRRLTFLGVPLGNGYRFGVDPDDDGLFDIDELLASTDPKVADSDGDGYPDGHEVEHGSSPTQATSTPVDLTPPQVHTYASGKRFAVIYTSTSTTKFDFATSEACRVRVTSPGHPSFHVTSPVEGFARNHSVIVGGLPASEPALLSLELTDPAGNQGFDSLLVSTQAPRAPDAAVLRIEAITPVPNPTPFVTDRREIRLRVTITQADGAPAPRGTRLSAFAYLHDGTGWTVLAQEIPAQQMTRGGSVNGAVDVRIPIPDDRLGRSPARLAFGVRELLTGVSASFYVEGLDRVNYVEIDL